MRLALAAVLLLLLAPGAHAAAQDSLLSGYGGPGDGEQALLGQTLIRGSGGSAPAASSPAAASTAPAPGPDAIYAPAPAQTTTPARPATPAQNAAAKPHRSPTPQQRPSHRTPAKPAATPKPAAVSVVAASAPSPIGTRDIGLTVAILFALVVLAAVARRLAVRAARARRPLPVYEP